jgi:hypothetical protein
MRIVPVDIHLVTLRPRLRSYHAVQLDVLVRGLLEIAFSIVRGFL